MSSPTLSAASPSARPKSRRRDRTWLKRGSLGVIAMLIGLSGIGAIYQAVATANDRRTYSPQGNLVDIGGRRIHMLVMGEDTGKPTVILEAGMASYSSNYFWIQSELAADTRVVAYDRAGLGWSDPSPEPQDAQQSARDLHSALLAANIPGPYVVAGHSYGGLVVRAFTDLYPDEVVGMVLIDASHPDQWARMPVSREGKVPGYGNLLTGILARIGVVRLFRLESALYTGLPAAQAAEMEAVLAKPETWQSSGRVLLLWGERSRQQVNQSHSLGDLPLAVISVTEQPLVGDALTELQSELPGLSINSIHHTETGATHESLVAERGHAMVVVKTIRLVLEAAQTGLPLSEIARAGE